MPHLDGNTLLTLLAAYGYWAVLVLVAVESTGVPVPGEAMLIAASIYAGTTHRLHIILVLVAAAAGAILGDNLGFLLGRQGGYRLLHRYGKYVWLDERKLHLGQHLFDCHGGKIVFFGRFVAVLRVWAAFLAGAHAMPWRRFLAFNAAGGIAWVMLMGLGAYIFGNSVLRLGGAVGAASATLATVMMVAVTIALHRKERRLQQELDAGLPGCDSIAA